MNRSTVLYILLAFFLFSGNYNYAIIGINNLNGE